MQCPVNACRSCGGNGGVPFTDYIEAGRHAANNAKNKVGKSRKAPAGPGWIAKYLEKEFPECDKDTPVCSSCIEEHETKYSRKWEITSSSEVPLCAAGFWSCTEIKGLQHVELGDERAALQKSHGIYCAGAHIRLCCKHVLPQQRAAKKMEQQADAVTGTAGSASALTAGTADPHSNKRSNSGSTGQSPHRKRSSGGSGDGKDKTNSTDVGDRASKSGSAIGNQLNPLRHPSRHPLRDHPRRRHPRLRHPRRRHPPRTAPPMARQALGSYGGQPIANLVFRLHA